MHAAGAGRLGGIIDDWCKQLRGPHRRSTVSNTLGRKRPLTISRCVPSRLPLVPSSASRNCCGAWGWGWRGAVGGRQPSAGPFTACRAAHSHRVTARRTLLPPPTAGQPSTGPLLTPHPAASNQSSHSLPLPHQHVLVVAVHRLAQVHEVGEHRLLGALARHLEDGGGTACTAWVRHSSWLGNACLASHGKPPLLPAQIGCSRTQPSAPRPGRSAQMARPPFPAAALHQRLHLRAPAAASAWCAAARPSAPGCAP